MDVRRFHWQPFGALAAVAVLIGCSSSSPGQSGVTYASYKFSCCSGPDIQQTWHPGQTVEMHWIVQDAGQTTDNRRHSITLTAVMTGSYADAMSLKSGAVASRTLRAPAINTDDRTPTAPSSIFTLPSDLPPGLYNLVLGVDFGGGNSWSAASIIQMGPP
jgi:hypothetical protein